MIFVIVVIKIQHTLIIRNREERQWRNPGDIKVLIAHTEKQKKKPESFVKRSIWRNLIRYFGAWLDWICMAWHGIESHHITSLHIRMSHTSLLNCVIDFKSISAAFFCCFTLARLLTQSTAHFDFTRCFLFMIIKTRRWHGNYGYSTNFMYIKMIKVKWTQEECVHTHTHTLTFERVNSIDR